MGPAENITSPQNSLLREIRRAAARHSVTESGYWLAEGFHLLDEALHSRCEIGCILSAERNHDRVMTLWANAPAARLVFVPDAVFSSISAVETAQGVLALVRPKAWSWDDLFHDTHSLLLVLDQIQDPGNAGTMLRCAEAFGATGILFLKGSVQPWNPKTIRASAGSVFRVPHLAAMEGEAWMDRLQKRGIALWATAPRGGMALEQTPLCGNCAVVIGNEGSGIRDFIAKRSQTVSIPTAGVESLNAGIAASLVLYEAARQRRTSSR